MPISDETVLRARKLDRLAAEAVLTESYAPVWRIAHGLIGRADVARKVVDSVLATSLRVLPAWKSGLTPANWFIHHTLLSSRLKVDPAPSANEDLLVVVADDQPAEYLAFIGAMRKLPVQQREAFILHHGEGMTERQLGVAMDSSTTAATNHLRAATERLDAVTGGNGSTLIKKMAEAYRRLSPVDKAVVPYIRQQVGWAIWRRRMIRAIRRVLILALLGGLGYAGWHYRAQLVEWYHQLRESLLGQT